MTKFVSTFFILLPLFFIENLALDAESYVTFIEERSRDENFVEEYTKWSSKLLSQPGYLYGNSHAKFPCSINASNDNNTIPTSVHKLRPSDIKCIGAMGDSFTTGLGARGTTPMDLLFEDRGISWSVGGDYTYSQIPTIPNALRKYNSTLRGFSTKGYVLSRTQHITNTQLNVAKSGDRSRDMLSQANFLIYLWQNKSLCDWKNDWKMITIFVGANDLCNFCDNPNDTNHTPERYLTNIRQALDRLYNASIPRILINLVLPPDVRGFKEYTNDTSICQTFLQQICPCAAFPTVEQAKILDDYIPRYQELLQNLTNSGRYDGRDDFTVVIQPFMAKTRLPYQNNNTIDFSYLSPDCFHFSGKGHSQAAISLWNNMLEPVGIKNETWNINGTLKCPTAEYPYIFTSKNSAKALEEFKRNNTVQSTSNAPIIPDTNSTLDFNTTDNSTFPVSSNISTSTIQTNSTSMINTTTMHRHKPRKDKKGKSDSSLNKTKLVVIAGFSLILLMILIVGIMRRRKRFTLIVQSGDGKFNRLSEESDDDMDLYTRPTATKSDVSDNTITKTHGTRMPLD